MQEVWIKVYRSLGNFDGRARFSTWLYRVTRNTCLDQVRAGARRPIPVDPIDAIAVPGDLADEVALTASVEQAMRALSPEDRDAFSAVALYGLTLRRGRRDARRAGGHRQVARVPRAPVAWPTCSASRRVVPRWTATTRKTSISETLDGVAA